ncbi:MAG: FHA domain-containing protein [Pseudonocardiaceae bacterium]
MLDHVSPAPGDLTMTLSTTRPATLYGRSLSPGEQIRLLAGPGGVPFRIGRHAENPLVLGRPKNRHGDTDESISKTICEIAFEDGLWGIRCLSASHPIELTERDRFEILPVCADPDLTTRRVLVPPGARVSIPSPHEQYHMRITIDDPRTEPRLTLPLPKEGNPTKSRMPKPNDRDRLLLTAKFLYNNIPVEAVGDAEAAEIASAVLARRYPQAELVTRDDVEKRVYYWRGLLKDRGVECISGQQHTNDVGTQLLAWGVLAPSDLRELLN